MEDRINNIEKKVNDCHSGMLEMVSSYDDHFNRMMSLVDKSGNQVKECIDISNRCFELLKSSDERANEAEKKANLAVIASCVSVFISFITALIVIIH